MCLCLCCCERLCGVGDSGGCLHVVVAVKAWVVCCVVMYVVWCVVCVSVFKGVCCTPKHL